MNKQPSKIRDRTWDFKNADTKKYTHCFHSYPAMMIPQIAGRILDEFGKDAKILFDPYCGTGTSLVEANIRGIDAIGTDINPLARLIAKVKTTTIPIEKLDFYIKQFADFILTANLSDIGSELKIPSFKNIDYWFKKETQIMLAAIKGFIDKIDDPDVQDFFKVAFSETVREASLTKNGEFKLYRMSKKQIEKFNPDVFSVMLQKLLRNKKGMSEYVSAKRGNAKAYIYDFNTVHGIPQSIIPPRSIDIVITSPPYGDSRTTVAYGQFSRLSNQWLGFEDFNEVDKRSMGGVKAKKIIKFNFEPLDSAIKDIETKDLRRALDVVAFYIDYKKSIENVSKVVKENGIVAYAVGNRKVKGVQIPNDEITREFFQRNGFEHIVTIIREIPNKRMPKRNSPSNIVGQTDSTILSEFIVILKKR